ncbi:MAG: hypothetical protein IJ899_18305, partial [Blautia sp.]|nr:hypothetical protein [Blautia sp.]
MDRKRIYLAALAFLLYVALPPPKAYADIIYLSNEEISNLEAGPVTDGQDTVYLNGVLYYVRDGYLEEVVSSPSSIDIHETGLEELIG